MMSRSHRRGFTLIELVVGLVGAGALLAGLAATVFLAVKATDPSKTSTAAITNGAAALTDLLSDLEFAQSFSERSATAITFIVPDRNADDLPETIRYAWSGTPGDPITRQYNKGAVATFIENVHVFQHDLQAVAPNLLSNPGMESGTLNWQAIPGSNMYSDSSTVYAGSKSQYAYRTKASNESGIRQDVTSKLSLGQSYDIGAWMRKWAAPAPYDVVIQLRINSSGGGEQVFATDPFMINNKGYQLVMGSVTPKWGGSLISAYWEATGVSNIQDIYVDEAYLRARSGKSQTVNVTLQVGSDSQALIHSGVRLLNQPL